MPETTAGEFYAAFVGTQCTRVGGNPPVTAALFIVAQLLGAVAGAWLAHAMFDLPILQTSSKIRAGWGQWIAEAVATGGLIFVILRSPLGRQLITSKTMWTTTRQI